MENMKKFILDCLQDGEEEEQLEGNKEVSVAENNKHNEKILETSRDFENEDVPIFTAEPKQLDYWHAFGCSVMLQRFLRRYDLNECTRAYNAFKIGLDEEQHAITLAIDDENHYFKIQLEENNATPIDETQAEKILNKVNSMRYERLKNAPYWI